MLNAKSDQFSVYQKIHFIGIGGIGISALARILAQNGHIISGSDQNSSALLESLQNEGIKVHLGHSERNIDSDCQLIVHTSAIPANNPELIEAQKRNLPTLSYPQAVGKLTKDYQTISICGTHGKTTTTAMIGLSLLNNQADPTIIVGSLLKELNNKNEHIGKSDLFVLESCEYQESFLNYHPKIIVLNNIEAEHLDYFKTAENYYLAYDKFIKQIQPNGLLIANGDDEQIQYIIKQNPQIKTITFGLSPKNDYQIVGSQILKNNLLIAKLNLTLPGLHNLFNATATIVISEYLQLNLETTIKTLNNFSGAARRFEIKGQLNHKTTIIDDYGHTPAEIRATLQGVKEKFGQDSKVLCIFQPHQYSRTYQFLDQFAQSFGQASQIYIPNIYRTRDSEEDLKKVSPEKLVESIAHYNPNIIFTDGLENTLKKIKATHQEFDVIITMGAGDITNLSNQIIQTLQ